MIGDPVPYPSRLLAEAVEAIGSLPGVGSRSALRLALYLLGQPKENVVHFTQSISRMREEIKHCRICNMIADEEECGICRSRTRLRTSICVVESIRDVMSIEATGRYHGLYHVLGGIISPISGVGPADLSIPLLLQRIGEWSETDDGQGEGLEIIFALSGDVEGETTAFYLYRQIEALLQEREAQENDLPVRRVRMTTLARGLGFGADLEYADALTLGRSIENRLEFKPGEKI